MRGQYLIIGSSPIDQTRTLIFRFVLTHEENEVEAPTVTLSELRRSLVTQFVPKCEALLMIARPGTHGKEKQGGIGDLT